uniref:Uncharacterized protein n=1 Tax=Acrobeloides nanus TaxID=290746 RepID=A0A914CXM2_9BILA
MKSMLILTVSLLVIFVEKGEFSNLRCLPNIPLSIDGTLDITGDILAKGSLLLNGDFVRNPNNVNQGLLDLAGSISVNTSNSPDDSSVRVATSTAQAIVRKYDGPTSYRTIVKITGPADLTQTVLLINNGVKHEQLTINGVVPGYALVESLIGQLC